MLLRCGDCGVNAVKVGGRGRLDRGLELQVWIYMLVPSLPASSKELRMYMSTARQANDDRGTDGAREESGEDGWTNECGVAADDAWPWPWPGALAVPCGEDAGHACSRAFLPRKRRYRGFISSASLEIFHAKLCFGRLALTCPSHTYSRPKVSSNERVSTAESKSRGLTRANDKVQQRTKAKNYVQGGLPPDSAKHHPSPATP